MIFHYCLHLVSKAVPRWKAVAIAILSLHVFGLAVLSRAVVADNDDIRVSSCLYAAIEVLC